MPNADIRIRRCVPSVCYAVHRVISRMVIVGECVSFVFRLGPLADLEAV